jgi:hypothetical protein
MTFSRNLLSSVLLAGAVFAVATFPLAVSGSKQVAIQVEGKPAFAGPFRDLSTPYLGLALAMSIGAGVTHLSLKSWQAAARKLNRAEEQLAYLKQQLSEKEAVIESLTFSPQRLQVAGLDQFLQETPRKTRNQREMPKRKPQRKPQPKPQSVQAAEVASLKNSHAQIALDS